MSIYHYIYKIINNVNGKIYIGKHSTDNLDDGYLGSGKILSFAKEKYGIENFTKEILKFCSNEKEAFELEKHFIVEMKSQANNYYNIKDGGNGGFEHINTNKQFYIEKSRKTVENWSEERTKEVNAKKVNRGEKNGMYGSSRTRETNPMWGKKQSKFCREATANASRGKIGVKDAITGEKIGQVEIDHKNIKSGKWIHSNSGYKHSEEYKREKSIKYKEKGMKPPSCKDMLWWKKGIICKRAKDCPGEGWIKGRIKKCETINKEGSSPLI